jgi:hypothetical protein
MNLSKVLKAHHRVIIAAFLYFILNNTLSAQLNLKAGYQAYFTDPSVNNAILSAHNQQNTYYTQKFDDLKYLNGIHAGLRYKADAVGFEIGWTTKLKSTSAKGIPPNQGSEIQNIFRYRMNTVSAGMESYFGKLGIGATIDYNFLKIRPRFEEPDLTENFTDNAFSSHFNLVYTFQDRQNLSIAIKPFIQYFWDKFDLTEFDQQLNGTLTQTSHQEDFMSFGIMLIFYNGPQN